MTRIENGEGIDFGSLIADVEELAGERDLLLSVLARRKRGARKRHKDGKRGGSRRRRGDANAGDTAKIELETLVAGQKRELAALKEQLAALAGNTSKEQPLQQELAALRAELAQERGAHAEVLQALESDVASASAKSAASLADLAAAQGALAEASANAHAAAERADAAEKEAAAVRDELAVVRAAEAEAAENEARVAKNLAKTVYQRIRESFPTDASFTGKAVARTCKKILRQSTDARSGVSSDAPSADVHDATNGNASSSADNKCGGGDDAGEVGGAEDDE